MSKLKKAESKTFRFTPKFLLIIELVIILLIMVVMGGIAWYTWEITEFSLKNKVSLKKSLDKKPLALQYKNSEMVYLFDPPAYLQHSNLELTKFSYGKDVDEQEIEKLDPQQDCIINPGLKRLICYKYSQPTSRFHSAHVYYVDLEQKRIKNILPYVGDLDCQWINNDKAACIRKASGSVVPARISIDVAKDKAYSRYEQLDPGVRYLGHPSMAVRGDFLTLTYAYTPGYADVYVYSYDWKFITKITSYNSNILVQNNEIIYIGPCASLEDKTIPQSAVTENCMYKETLNDEDIETRELLDLREWKKFDNIMCLRSNALTEDDNYYFANMCGHTFIIKKETFSDNKPEVELLSFGEYEESVREYYGWLSFAVRKEGNHLLISVESAGMLGDYYSSGHLRRHLRVIDMEKCNGVVDSGCEVPELTDLTYYDTRTPELVYDKDGGADVLRVYNLSTKNWERDWEYPDRHNILGITEDKQFFVIYNRAEEKYTLIDVNGDARLEFNSEEVRKFKQ